MWGMLKRHEVKILLKAGHPKTGLLQIVLQPTRLLFFSGSRNS